jgi:hypothetical protein
MQSNPSSTSKHSKTHNSSKKVVHIVPRATVSSSPKAPKSSKVNKYYKNEVSASQPTKDHQKRRKKNAARIFYSDA